MLESQNASAQERYVILLIYIESHHALFMSTEILVLDSLGAKHPQVHAKLSSYLQNKASIRNRTIDKTRKIVTRDITVRYFMTLFYVQFYSGNICTGSLSTERLWLCSLPTTLCREIHVSPNDFPETN